LKNVALFFPIFLIKVFTQLDFKKAKDYSAIKFIFKRIRFHWPIALLHPIGNKASRKLGEKSF
jgi:hypothetical protein